MESECPYSLQYLMECNFHFANLKDVKIEGKKFTENLFLQDVKKVKIKDEYLGKTIEFKFGEEINVFIAKVDTVSQSESGFDLTNQALSFGFILPFEKGFSLEGSLNIGE